MVKINTYHRLGALYKCSDGAFQMSIFSWCVSEDKDIRGGWSSSQGKLSLFTGQEKMSLIKNGLELLKNKL